VIQFNPFSRLIITGQYNKFNLVTQHSTFLQNNTKHVLRSNWRWNFCPTRFLGWWRNKTF